MYIQHIKLYNNNSQYQKQIGYDTYDDRMWVRTKSANTWSSWKAIITSDNIGSYALTSLPAHNHDDRYYTETESDSRYVNTSGDTIATSSQYALIINHGAATADFSDALTVRATTSGQQAQIGMATNDTDGDHHRVSLRAYKGSGTFEGVFGIAMRQAGSSTHLQQFTFNANGNLTIAGTFTEQSSIRYKENVKSIPSVSEKVEKLDAVSYNKIGSNQEEIGLIAEDVAELFPEVVKYDNEGRPDGVNYSRLSVILLKAVQELTERVNKLENK
jgi:hypothetical protein